MYNHIIFLSTRMYQYSHMQLYNPQLVLFKSYLYISINICHVGAKSNKKYSSFHFILVNVYETGCVPNIELSSGLRKPGSWCCYLYFRPPWLRWSFATSCVIIATAKSHNCVFRLHCNNDVSAWLNRSITSQCIVTTLCQWPFHEIVDDKVIYSYTYIHHSQSLFIKLLKTLQSEFFPQFMPLGIKIYMRFLWFRRITLMSIRSLNFSSCLSEILSFPVWSNKSSKACNIAP